MIDTRAGNYRLVERIGSGGMGEVYKAVHDTIGSRVAIKILTIAAAREHDAEERFIREAQAVNRIQHDGVVKVVDAGRLDSGQPYLVMELLDGQPLSELIKTSRPSIIDACRIVADVLDALAAAHAAGIIHRDLKPANIFRTTSGRIVVLDFGIAKILGSGRLTQGNMAIGTPHYMAPEQIREGGHVGPHTDVYAAGLVLFELLCGRRAFESVDPGEVMLAHLERRPPPPRALVPEIPMAISDLVLAALAKDPARRPVSAGAMRDALRDAIDSPPERPSGRVPPRIPETPLTTKRPRIPSAAPVASATAPTRRDAPPLNDTLADRTPLGVRRIRRRGRAVILGGLALAAIAGVAAWQLVGSKSAPAAAVVALPPDAAVRVEPPVVDAPIASDPCMRLEQVDVLDVPANLRKATSAMFLGMCLRDGWPEDIVGCLERSAGVNDEVERCLGKLPPEASASIAAAIAELATKKAVPQVTTRAKTATPVPKPDKSDAKAEDVKALSTKAKDDLLPPSAGNPFASGSAAPKPVYAQLEVTSNPAGARLVVDGIGIGITPWHGTIKPSTVELTLTLASYMPARIRLDVKSDRKNVWHANLQKDSRDAVEIISPFLDRKPGY